MGRVIELAYPHKALWPNGRPNRYGKARQVKAHRRWAWAATLADQARPPRVARIIATFYAKPAGPLPDRDNCVAALKPYLDGIADALKVNDRDFPVPTILFGERVPNGRVVIVLEGE